MSKDSKLLLGLIVGVAAGAAAGLLIAPSSGKETREKIKEASTNFKEDLDKKLNELSSKLDKETIDDIKNQFGNLKGKAKEEYDIVAKKVKDLEHEIETKIKDLKKQAAKLNSEKA